jgi:2-polyprenyl-3-methyl-5-hydroxy-6-metoxy-1,4-benzoquinol methylase
MRVVPFSELDDLLDYFDEGYKSSHDEAYRRFSESQLAPPDDLPPDPFSDEYAARYLALHKKISNRAEYSVQNERSEFDVDSLTLRPYPYFTKSLKRAAQHYTLMGKLMEIMEVKEGADILECGFGWGNTTLALAMLGHNVTAIDIEQRYCELVRRRAEMLKIHNLMLVNSDFLWVETTAKKFDAVCFFESFHHCWEFKRLLHALHRVLKPGGKIYFGAEPINSDFTVPWGVRLDGESLWVARRAGWMELGFHSDFFVELLTRTGWEGKCVHPHFWVATCRFGPIVIPATDLKMRSQIGKSEGGLLVVNAPAGDHRYALFGPYIALQKGNYRAELKITVKEPREGSIIDVCCDDGKLVLHSHPCTAAEMTAGMLSGDFSVPEKVEDLEVRLRVPGGFSGVIEQLSIVSTGAGVGAA